ncbi:hypothetical protein L596_026151 [Steinernema carpocapsae]|uniref:Uncharacterized protein n=1 Tax=Steinernema carpocapsae TaxID=34508 RepID=A0A4V5ZY45_STECR|nr:hypothetical protein L596_026151 [Steinernema carpocapsae]
MGGNSRSHCCKERRSWKLRPEALCEAIEANEANETPDRLKSLWCFLALKEHWEPITTSSFHQLERSRAEEDAPGFWGQRIDLWYGLPALQGIMRLNTDGKIEAKKLFSYKMHQDHCARPVSVLDFPIPLPKIDRREPHSKWCFSPSYLNPNPEGLVDVSTFAHLTSDLDKIRNHFEKIGFQEYLGDIEKALEGREIRRLKILGYCQLAGSLIYSFYPTNRLFPRLTLTPLGSQRLRLTLNVTSLNWSRRQRGHADLLQASTLYAKGQHHKSEPKSA